MDPIKKDYTCKAGSTWRKSFRLKGQHETLTDLTDLVGRMHIRAAIDDDVVLVKFATSEVTPVVGELWGTITIDVATATVTMYMPASVTTALGAGSFVYDMELVDSNDEEEVICPIYGKIKVAGEVTR